MWLPEKWVMRRLNKARKLRIELLRKCCSFHPVSSLVVKRNSKWQLLSRRRCTIVLIFIYTKTEPTARIIVKVNLYPVGIWGFMTPTQLASAKVQSMTQISDWWCGEGEGILWKSWLKETIETCLPSACLELILSTRCSQTQQYMPVIPARRRLKQENQEFDASLDNAES